MKTEIIEELERHRDAELAEQREKRHKAEAEKAHKDAEQSTNTDETKVTTYFILLRDSNSFCWKHLHHTSVPLSSSIIAI